MAGELIRSLMWAVTSLLLNIIDSLWAIAKMIVGLDFANQDWIWQWLNILNLFLIFFIVLFSAKTYIKAYVDEDHMNKIDITKIITKLILVGFFVAVLPFTIRTVSTMSSTMASNIEVFTGVGDAKLSSIIINSSSMDLSDIDEEFTSMGDILNAELSSANNDIMSETEWQTAKDNKINDTSNRDFALKSEYERVAIINEQLKATYEEYVEWQESLNYDSIIANNYWVTEDVNDIDINSGETSGQWYDYLLSKVSFGLAGDVETAYYFFPSWSSLFLVLITTLLFTVIFIGVIFQLAQRVFSMVLKIFLMPYAVSTMVDPESRTFSTWIKYMMADVLSNWFQLYSIMFLFAFLGNDTLENLLVGSGSVTIQVEFAKLFLLAGGLMAIYTGPSGIAAILGGSEISAASSLSNTTQMLRMATSMTGMVAGGLGLGYLGATAGVGTAGKLANTGTRVASAGLNTVTGGRRGNAFSNSQGIAGRIKNTSIGGALHSGFYGGGSTGGGITPDTFNSSPTDSQMNMASGLGINPEGMNQGQLGIEIDKATGGQYTADTGQNNSTGTMSTKLDKVSGIARKTGSMHNTIKNASRNRVNSSAIPIYLKKKG
ncbi:MAG: hypothetical protein PHI41_08570 [Erysipelotrichaceae bacterium]|nr:hypothetical protein [Erysipelotrichaceae bacterium]